jgi:predicted  nucleic acid-binding Zn-ribbon protein
MTVCTDCGYPYDAAEELKYSGEDVAACPQCGCEGSKEFDEDAGRER